MQQHETRRRAGGCGGGDEVVHRAISATASGALLSFPGGGRGPGGETSPSSRTKFRGADEEQPSLVAVK